MRRARSLAARRFAARASLESRCCARRPCQITVSQQRLRLRETVQVTISLAVTIPDSGTPLTAAAGHRHGSRLLLSHAALTPRSKAGSEPTRRPSGAKDARVFMRLKLAATQRIDRAD